MLADSDPAPDVPPQSPVTRGALAVGGIARVIGTITVLLQRIVAACIRREVDKSELLKALYKMGLGSLPVVVLTALFTGGIMVIQAAPIVERFGAHGLLGWGAGFGTLREVGPLLTALMISGRVGANNAAELATMAVTEQIDALRALAIDPLGFLLAPRCVSIVITLFLSTLFADALALLGAAYAGQLLLDVDPQVFYRGLTEGLLGFSDVAHGLIKSLAFGLVIGLSSCHFGLNTEGGATAVGRSVNASVVTSAVGIFAFDYALSFVLQ